MMMETEKDDLKNELFVCCREGRLDRVKELVQYFDVPINIRDIWDSTPLYYACVCGREQIVGYLLRNGARCEANTFDGERCLYAALTQSIKEQLKEFKAIPKNIIRRDNYTEFFRTALQSQTHKDICFIVHGAQIFAHRVILAARSTYFSQMLEQKWRNKKYIHLRNPLVAESAFRLVLQYLYIDQIDIEMDDIPDLKRLCRQCRLVDLQEKIEEAERNFHSYADTKPKFLRDNVSVLSIQSDVNLTLGDSFIPLAETCIPFRLRNDQFPDCLPDIFFMELPELEEDESSEHECGDYVSPGQIPEYADICFVIEDYYFYGHKVFFCGRSPYFRSLESFFSVSENASIPDDGILRIPLHEITPDVFTIITTFIYTGQVLIPDELLEDVLHFAAMYLIPNLKRFCSNRLENLLSVETVLGAFKLSRLYDLSSLEASCCHFISQYLEELIHDEEFADIVMADVNAIQNRQESKTNTIVDDIRYHLSIKELPGFSWGSSMDDDYFPNIGSPQNSFNLLDNLLSELGLA